MTIDKHSIVNPVCGVRSPVMVMLGFLLRFMRAHPSILVSISIVLFLQPTTTTTTGEVVELVEMEIEHGRWQRIALATVELLVRPYVSNCQSGMWKSNSGSDFNTGKPGSTCGYKTYCHRDSGLAICSRGITPGAGTMTAHVEWRGDHYHTTNEFSWPCDSLVWIN